MSPAVPSVPGIENYLQIGPEGAVLQIPARDFRVQGALVAVLLPVLFVLLALLVGLSAEDDGVMMVSLGFAAVASPVSAAGGVVMIVLAPWSSRRTRTQIGPDGVVTLANGVQMPLELIRSVRVDKPDPMMKWIGLVGKTAGHDVVLLRRMPPSQIAVANALAAWVGERAGIPVDPPGAAATNVFGFNTNSHVALCYVPVQGIWLIVSLGSLILAREPRVRFAAAQALIFYFVTAVIGVAMLVLPMAVAMAVLDSPELGIVVAIPGMLVLIARPLLGMYAAYRGYVGRDLVFPGLGFLSPPEAISTDAGGVWAPPKGG